MRKTFNLPTNKSIIMPGQMYTFKQLNKMDLRFVKNSIFVNIYDSGKKANRVDKDIKNNMAIINYPDFSSSSFSISNLKSECLNQVKSEDTDFVILPASKNETQYEESQKLTLAGELKKITDKPIIIEISYKSSINTRELMDNSKNFDLLSIYYGVKYGHLVQYEKLVTRIVEFKYLTNKGVLCTAVPLKFAGANVSDVRYMPCFDLICDGWLKNWKPGGGGPREVKLTDIHDLRDKTYTKWLETGHTPHERIMIIDRTVFDMFHNSTYSERDEYHVLISDEVLSEIRNVDPMDVEDYVLKFHRSFHGHTIWGYSEMLIQILFRNNNIFDQFIEEDRKKIEYAIRERKRPSQMYPYLTQLIKLVEENKITSVPLLLKMASNY